MALRTLLILGITLLSGCEQPLTLNKICEETPGFCEDLNKDSRCRNLRTDLIFARYHEYKAPTDENKFQLLKRLESYRACVDLASKIEHTKLKEKTTSRVEGHLTSLKEIKRIFNDTKNTNHPGLLYYHWSRDNNQSAINKLLKMQEHDQVKNDPEIQMYLASYFAKFDEEKTIDLLYRVLELNKAGEQPKLEVYSSLVSIFFKQRKYKHAYTFAKVAQMSDFEDIDILPIKHEITSRGNSLSSLDKLAEQTFDEIQSGTFVSPREF